MDNATRHLTPGQRALLRAELELRQRQLDQQLALHQEGRSRVEHARDVLERDHDDAPQRAMDREVDLALSDIDTHELGLVSRALLRLDAEDFGACADCGEGIPFDRLRVEPHALRCVACESRHETNTQRKA
ncbi:MAG: TraR/DksA family transcriptional regulator [Rubrivivax sp.]|nr:TraR/DksA family transcriptional regulator [Rubrivivax sp.]